MAVAAPGRGQRRPGPDRLPAPLRPGLRRRPARRWQRRARAGCTPCGPPRSTRRRRRRPTSPPPAGSSATAAIHDFDAVRWVTGREVVEVYATGVQPGRRRVHRLGDADTATPLLTLDDGTSAWSPTPATTAAATTSPGAARHDGLRRRRPGRRAAAALGRARRDLPGRHAAHVLHGPLRRRLPRRARRLHRGRRRQAPSPCTIADGARGGAGSPRPPRVAARAPAGAHR